MEHLLVTPPDILDLAQAVFNHPSIISHLGGFTMRDMLRDKVKRQLGLWVCQNDAGEYLGATMVAGRPQSHLLKYGSVGVVEAHRRKRIGSALYAAMTAQGILEGRRLFEDTIVGDNPTQFHVLPTLGIKQSGTLRHRTASGKDICLFQISMMDSRIEWVHLLKRVPVSFKIVLWENSYTDDLWAKNMEILGKYDALKSHVDWFLMTRDSIRSDPRFKVVRQVDPPKQAKPVWREREVPADEVE